jgi:DNA-binding transcriptional LysR family regulator
MDWHQLLGFYHVARLGSFTKAAEVTFRTQSALSQQVKALEEEFDCQLFERIGKRTVRLTPAGEKLFQFSATLLEKFASLKEDLNDIKGLHKGRLRLAAPFTTLYHLFPNLVKIYTRQFPNVELTLLDRSQPSVIALVKSGDIDFGLTLESAVPKDLAALRWKEVKTFLLAPLGHPLSRLKRVTLSQIAKYPLIFPPKSHSGRARLEDHFQRLGLNYHIIMESSNVELSSLYVEMGIGVSFATLVKDLSKLMQRNLEFIPLDHYFKPDYIALVMRKDKTLTPLKNSFITMLLEESFEPHESNPENP